jgi:endo-1,4-beta-xylanase
MRNHILALPLVVGGLCPISTLAQPGAPVDQSPGSVLPAAATQGMPAQAAVRPHPAEIPLWPSTPPGFKETPSGRAEIVTWRTEKDSITGESFSFPTVTNIHFPSLTPYLPPKEKATGAAVIIAPGGGHQFLTINHEGYDVAQRLADRGIAAFVLKYRLARSPSYPQGTYGIAEQALADGQRALRLVRSRAEEWNIHPDKIGFMGFSAGGEVAIQVNLRPADGSPDAADPVDRVPCTMNFEALIYPGVSRLVQPTKDWPPVFLAASYDDRPDIAGATAAPNAATRPAATGLAEVYLRYKAVGVPAELHLYSVGGHGFGARARPIGEARWPDRFVEWLADLGVIKP